VQEHVNAFADAMQSVGEAIEQRYERMQVEHVFGLTGGELEDKPLTFIAPTKFDGEQPRTWRYHYDGPPEWAAREDFPDHNERDVWYFTLIEIGVSYESYAPEWVRFEDGTTYYRMCQYVHSGETECTWNVDDDGNEGARVGEGCTKGLHECPMCGEKAGEEHGYIYLGDSTETVYKRAIISCDACQITAAECDADNPMCDCEVEE
jgi:hypothetical protein